MNLLLHNINDTVIAELSEDNGWIIKDAGDAVDLMGNASYLGANSLIIKKENLIEDFFSLSTGIAGDILQKFSNYNMRLAIVGDFSGYGSKSLKDFILESNRSGRILFVETLNDGLAKLKY